MCAANELESRNNRRIKNENVNINERNWQSSVDRRQLGNTIITFASENTAQRTSNKLNPIAISNFDRRLRKF